MGSLQVSLSRTRFRNLWKMWKLQNLSAAPSKLEPFLCKDENDHVAKGKYVLLQVLIFKFWLIVNPFIGSMNGKHNFEVKRTHSFYSRIFCLSLIGWAVAIFFQSITVYEEFNNKVLVQFRHTIEGGPGEKFSHAFCFSFSFSSCSWRRSGSATMGAVWALDGIWRKWWL